jgi:hypothetical protein
MEIKPRKQIESEAAHAARERVSRKRNPYQKWTEAHATWRAEWEKTFFNRTPGSAAP